MANTEQRLKLLIDINQQNALFTAFSRLDSYETLAPGNEKTAAKVVRVPYKLGAARRTIVKNMNALRASLVVYQEANKALFSENWPNAAEGVEISREDDPEKFDVYAAEQRKMIEAKDEIELLALPAAVIYGDNDFPNDALAQIDLHGLITDDDADA